MNPQPVDIACPATPTASGHARTLVESRLVDWGLGGPCHIELRGDICLVTAELVANACEADPYGTIRIRFLPEPAAVLLAVWDASEQLPERRNTPLTPDTLDLSPAHFDDNGGWGIPLVEALAAETGITLTHPHGKWIWARFKA